MPDAGHGEALFKGLLDYPLPQQAGVRDYVFYLGGTGAPVTARRRNSSSTPSTAITIP